MMRNFYRVAGPMRRETHGGREVLVPRDDSAAFEMERARKERDLFREVATIGNADGNVIAALASRIGPLGRIPQMSRGEAASVAQIVRMRTRESLAKLAERRDLTPLELLATAISQSAESALAGLPKARGSKALANRSLAAAALAEPLLRIEIEAIEVLFRAVRDWDLAEGPRRLLVRAAGVLRGRANKLAQSEVPERRATAAVLADLSSALESYARTMPAPSPQVRDILVDLKKKVMVQPSPTDKDWGKPVDGSEDDGEPAEGDRLGFVVRLTLDLWTRFQEEPLGEVWSLPTAPLWSAVWVIAPFMFTSMEKMPGWGVCIHETTEDWRRFGRECHAWARAVDALRAYEVRGIQANQDLVVARVHELLAQLGSVLGDSSALLAKSFAETAAGNERNTLERLLELRMEAAAITVLPARLKVLGTEGRALASVQTALGRNLAARRCTGVGCTNVLSVDAAPQTRKCKDCVREQGRKRQTRFRAHRDPGSARIPRRTSDVAVDRGHVGGSDLSSVLPVDSETARIAPEQARSGGRRGSRRTQHDGTRPVKEQVPSKGGER
jgi:hypothetical protein